MKKNIYGLILSALFVSVGLTSCLKDDDIDDQKYGLIDLNVNKIIEIPANSSHLTGLTLLPEGVKDVTMGEIRLAAENPASEDITVSLTSSKTSEIIGSDLPLFPLEGITVPATVTIPKGQRSVPLVVKVNTTLLQSVPHYFAISITAVDKQGYSVSGNFGYIKVNMKVKHKFEGKYVMSGTMTDVTSASLKHISTVNSNYNVELRTIDGTTIVVYDPLSKDYLYPIASGAAVSRFGTFSPQFTFDDKGNITAVTNYYVSPANTRAAEIDPSGVNKYDPDTKSFTVSYWMNQPSVVDVAPYHRCAITETYTFVED